MTLRHAWSRRRVTSLFIHQVDVRPAGVDEVRQRAHVTVHAGALERDGALPISWQSDERLAVAVARLRLIY